MRKLILLVTLMLFLGSCAKKDQENPYPFTEDYSDFTSPIVDEDAELEDLVDDEVINPGII